MHLSFRLCFALLLSSPLASEVVAQQSASSPWVATVSIFKDQGPTGSGVYLRSGLIITAAHLTDANATMSVRIAGKDLPATMLKQGVFEKVDLSLLSIDEQRLPERPAIPTMQLCETVPSPGDRVIVIDSRTASLSHIVSPQELPYALRQFSTLVANVGATGLSGSGVFDPNRKCLLGIMSRRLTLQTSNGVKSLKYFVPAADIREFLAEVAPSKR
jgi:hypothetical protein